VDTVIAIAVVGQQPELSRPTQQRGQRRVVGPGQRGHRVVSREVGVAHELQGVDVDRVAEQVQQREPRAFGFGEGVGETVGQ
jgi:hypothetical protein